MLFDIIKHTFRHCSQKFIEFLVGRRKGKTSKKTTNLISIIAVTTMSTMGGAWDSSIYYLERATDLRSVGKVSMPLTACQCQCYRPGLISFGID